MTVNTSLYQIKIINSDETITVSYRRCKKCKTAKGMDRQHNRIVNETVNVIRNSGFKRLTVSRVPHDTPTTV